MRLVTCKHRQRPHLGIVRDDFVVIPALANQARFGAYDTILSLIEAGQEAYEALQEWVVGTNKPLGVKVDQVELLAPIPRPRKNIMCLGWNYVDHAQESARTFKRSVKLPDHPVVFTKAVTSVNGPFADFVLDTALSNEIDWEVELGVVIGRKGRKIPRHEALKHVFGYTVINDISARDMQTRHRQFFLGKSLDGSCPMGPWIVTQDEVPDPQRLALRSWVNGELKQSSSTRFQIFDVATVISTLSQGMVLEPGDIIATGTPSGVGFARTPPEFLKPGDVVECEIESIGRIRNKVVASPELR
jgi:2-keto-4-pentenoate hydratase/2-oxohepta-3-ene-1,7-dioic acid hydratase in catechol pathway